MLFSLIQSLPIVWFILLWRVRATINPPDHRQPNELDFVLCPRQRDPRVQYLSFLWKNYLPSHWCHEIIDMYTKHRDFIFLLYKRLLFSLIIELLQVSPNRIHWYPSTAWERFFARKCRLPVHYFYRGFSSRGQQIPSNHMIHPYLTLVSTTLRASPVSAIPSAK